MFSKVRNSPQEFGKREDAQEKRLTCIFSKKKCISVSFKKATSRIFLFQRRESQGSSGEAVHRILLRRSRSPSCGLRQGRLSQTDWLGSAGEVDEHQIANSISGRAPEMPWPPTTC